MLHSPQCRTTTVQRLSTRSFGKTPTLICGIDPIFPEMLTGAISLTRGEDGGTEKGGENGEDADSEAMKTATHDDQGGEHGTGGQHHDGDQQDQAVGDETGFYSSD